MAIVFPGRVKPKVLSTPSQTFAETMAQPAQAPAGTTTQSPSAMGVEKVLAYDPAQGGQLVDQQTGNVAYPPPPPPPPGSIAAPKVATIGQASADIKAAGLTPSWGNVSAQNVAGINTNALPKVAYNNAAGVNTNALPKVSYNNAAGVNPNALPKVAYNNAAGIDINGLPQISGFDQSYYDNLRDQASKSLTKQYFGDGDSLSNRLTNTINKRGLIGSGIEVGNQVDLSKDFGSQMADIESNLATQQAQNDIENQKYNATNQINSLFKNTDVGLANATNSLSANKSNVDNTVESFFKNADIGLANSANQLDANKSNVDNTVESFFKNTDVGLANSRGQLDASKSNVDNTIESFFKNADISGANANRGLDAATANSTGRLDANNQALAAIGDLMGNTNNFNQKTFDTQVNQANNIAEGQDRRSQTAADLYSNPTTASDYRSFLQGDVIDPYLSQDSENSFSEFLAKQNLANKKPASPAQQQQIIQSSLGGAPADPSKIKVASDGSKWAWQPTGPKGTGPLGWVKRG